MFSLCYTIFLLINYILKFNDSQVSSAFSHYQDTPKLVASSNYIL